MGCGRCAAACPTGALESEGFQGMSTLRRDNAAVAVECARVPESALVLGALRVPCLGGIGLGQALAWADDAGERPLHLIDRGACGQCSAGGVGAHPATGLLERLCRTLAACGWPDTALPSLVHNPVGVRMAPLQVPAAKTVDARRRAFLLRPSQALAPAPDVITAITRRRRRANPLLLPGPQRTFASAVRLAAKRGRLPAASLLPRLRASVACRMHQACVATCPSGALVRQERETSVGIAFDAQRCIACAACVDACPEQALSLATREAHAALPDGFESLAEAPLQRCESCLDPFPGTTRSKVCERCLQAASMARDLFSLNSA